MINCFPRLYEDESLYSIASRYRRMCGLINKRNVYRDFYGKEKDIIVDGEFPLNLKEIEKQFFNDSTITSEEILMEHTMYPYYAGLLSKNKADKIRYTMLYKENKNILFMLGLGGSNIRMNMYLKYCPKCVEENLEKFGESYWRREHQFVGVLFCHKHQILLMDSNINSSYINNEYACVEDIYESYREDNFDKQILELNLTYIELTKQILKNKNNKLRIEEIRRFYLSELYKKNLASKNGFIYMKKLLISFKGFYSEKYLELMQSNYEIEDENAWLRRFFRSDRVNKHILRHLLVLQFLETNINELFEQAPNIRITKNIKSYKPTLDIEVKKKEWLKLINEHPNLSRRELKLIGKGLQTYVYKYARDWYNEVTPKHKTRKNKMHNINWEERDNEILIRVKEGIEIILNKEGRPVRICESSIVRQLGTGKLKSKPKLKRTLKYIEEITEDINDYRKRKIKWAVSELMDEGSRVTRNKVEVKAGFGNVCSKEIKIMIEEELMNL